MIRWNAAFECRCEAAFVVASIDGPMGVLQCEVMSLSKSRTCFAFEAKGFERTRDEKSIDGAVPQAVWVEETFCTLQHLERQVLFADATQPLRRHIRSDGESGTCDVTPFEPFQLAVQSSARLLVLPQHELAVRFVG
ncbi:hypothetical protein SAMN05446935_7635 [Burkholderia sp. YR290]|nr:hypothetical protein SAMN05446935_7635 [Burkholderia sp. YR290]